MGLARQTMLNGVLDAVQQKKPQPGPEINPGVLQMLQQQRPMMSGPVGVNQPPPQTMMQMPKPQIGPEINRQDPNVPRPPQQPPMQPPPDIGGVPQNYWTPGANGGNAQFNMPQSVLQAVQAGAGGQGGLPGGGAPGLRGGNPVDSGVSNPVSPPGPMLESLSQNVTGSDASLLNNLQAGTGADWVAQGGPSIAARLTPKMAGGTALDPFGLFKKPAADSMNIWGTPQQNAKTAQAGDYNAYMNANADLMPAYEKLQTADPRGYSHMLKSFDLNGNKKLEPGEYGQWHYQNAGKKEGRALTPVAGIRPGQTGQTPTLQQLQSGRGGVLGYLGG